MKLEKALNREVANLLVFYIKLHNYHWYVSGKEFYRLHEEFEEMYDEVTELYDEVAERMLMIGYKPVATLQQSLQVATIKEATGKETSKDMVAQVLEDYKLLNEGFNEVLELAEELNDDVTADLMTSTRANFQKHIWMLTEYLK